LEPTPGLALGPFFPLCPRPAWGHTLWADEATAIDRTERVEIRGRVTDRAGNAVRDAIVEIWQADEHGRYRHPSAEMTTQDEALFVGYCAQKTDPLGQYGFQTVMPGPYVESDGVGRAPHVHFQVTGTHDRLVTQMFFPGEPMNADDRWLRVASRPSQLIAAVVRESDSQVHFHWDIVLANG
jgi:protocatechuate 3,4-dioxygenase beta subunit